MKIRKRSPLLQLLRHPILPLLVVSLTLITFFAPSVLAAEHKFNIVYDLTYRVHEDGMTTAIQNFNLTNLTDSFFASQYQITIGNSEIYNLRVFDASGPLKAATRKNSDGLTATVDFRNLSPGEGKQLSWTVTYDTPDIAKKTGRIWQVSIPQPKPMPDNADYTIAVFVPDSEGLLLREMPQTGAQRFFWKKNDLAKSGIGLTFYPEKGPIYQNYDFEINYFLHNSKLYPTIGEIALPPDTNYQKIFLKNLSPKPIDVILDADGNWLAKYYLGAVSSLTVTATGSAAVFFKPEVPAPATVSPNDYLKKDRFWETDDRLISLKAKELKSTANILSYTASHLNYTSQSDKKPAERSGAKAALLKGRAQTSRDYADLFVALGRAAGIPTREIDGYLTTLQGSSPHAWPHYFDEDSKTWLYTDPTLQNLIDSGTYLGSFDLSHLALTIHGQRSDAPLPASAYRQEQSRPNIKLTPRESDLDIYTGPQISFRADIPSVATAGQGVFGKVFLENVSPVFAGSQKILLSADTLDIADPVLNSGPLPPFANRELDVIIRPTHWLKETDGIINLNIDSQTRSYKIKVLPIYRSSFVLVIGGLTALGIISLIAQIARSIFIQRQNGQNNLRRQS